MSYFLVFTSPRVLIALFREQDSGAKEIAGGLLKTKLQIILFLKILIKQSQLINLNRPTPKVHIWSPDVELEEGKTEQSEKQAVAHFFMEKKTYQPMNGRVWGLDFSVAEKFLQIIL